MPGCCIIHISEKKNVYDINSQGYKCTGTDFEYLRQIQQLCKKLISKNLTLLTKKKSTRYKFKFLIKSVHFRNISKQQAQHCESIYGN